MKPILSLVAALVLGLAPLAVSAADAGGSQAQRTGWRPLGVRVESMDWYGQDEAMTLRFSVNNPNAKSVWVLRHQVPSENMDAPLLRVTRDGQAVDYLGKLVKRAAPRAEDYIEIKGGQTLVSEFDPTGSYAVAEQGEYTVAFELNQMAVRTRAPQRHRDEEDAPVFMLRQGAVRGDLDTHPTGSLEVVAAPAVRFTFAGDPARAAEIQAPRESFRSVGGFYGCSSTRQSTLRTAHNNAITLGSKSLNYLSAYPNGGGLYTTWFGAYSSNRMSTVRSHFSKLRNAFVNQSVVYDCNCTDNSYAYVYPGSPYRIYICSAFWSAPALGRDSMAGTLIHEMSHFTVNGGTEDHVYGESGAKSLARTNPSKAVMNADNHEYFAEDQK